MYTVNFKDEDQLFETRSAAIEAAKELTGGSLAYAEVSDAKGIESLVYRAGEMESYVYDIRRVEDLRRGVTTPKVSRLGEDDDDDGDSSGGDDESA